MRKQIVTFLFFANILCYYSQDTIKFRNNEVKQVKVSEVGINDVKYRRFDNPEGPQYIANKNDISFIKYQNGHKDTFGIAAPAVVASAPSVSQSSPSSFSSSAPRLISVDGSRLVYGGRGLGDSKLFRLIDEYQYPKTKTIMLDHFKTYKKYKRNQYISGFVGLGVGVLAPYIGLMTSLFSIDPNSGSSDFTPFVAGIAIGATVGITGGVLSSICKHKRTAEKREIARLYNEMK